MVQKKKKRNFISLSVYLGLLFYEYHLFSWISIKNADSMAIWFKVSQDLMDSFY